MVAKKKAKENKGAATTATEQPKEVVATATPAAVTTKIGGTPTEIERAEKMIDRLEGERIKADEALKQQAENLSRVIGVLKMLDDRGALSLGAAAGPDQAPAAGAEPEEPKNLTEEFIESIVDHFDAASFTEILTAFIYHELMRLGETRGISLATTVNDLCASRLSKAESDRRDSDEYGEHQVEFGILMGLRACRS